MAKAEGQVNQTNSHAYLANSFDRSAAKTMLIAAAAADPASLRAYAGTMIDGQAEINLRRTRRSAVAKLQPRPRDSEGVEDFHLDR
jgi:hypothetical protein